MQSVREGTGRSGKEEREGNSAARTGRRRRTVGGVSSGLSSRASSPATSGGGSSISWANARSFRRRRNLTSTTLTRMKIAMANTVPTMTIRAVGYCRLTSHNPTPTGNQRCQTLCQNATPVMSPRIRECREVASSDTPDTRMATYTARSSQGSQKALHSTKIVLITATTRSNECHHESLPLIRTSAKRVAKDCKKSAAASTCSGIPTSGFNSKLPENQVSSSTPSTQKVKLLRP
mmetsp:Transcript_64348/g.140068  ORF Transcript_64348/g.140068 Transcript_64348/m.140068 type:complete len:234 (+) Transcript_64348:91-792(+)